MEYFDSIVELVGHLAWPVTCLILVVVVRNHIADLIGSIAERIRDPKSEVDISKAGLKVTTKIDAAQGRIESLEIEQEQIKNLVESIRPAPRAVRAAAAPETVDPELQALAEEYCQITHPSWSDRVRLKDDAARRMANLVVTRNVSRDLLAAQHHEGLIMALASVAHAFPQAEDTDRLLRVTEETNRLHVRYRIVLALTRLVEKRWVSPEQLVSIEAVLSNYLGRADGPLKRRIRRTRAILQDLADEA